MTSLNGRVSPSPAQGAVAHRRATNDRVQVPRCKVKFEKLDDGDRSHEINTTYVDLRVNEGIRGLLHSQRTMGVDARRTGWATLI